MSLRKPFLYLWASPASALGLTATLLGLLSGGRARVRKGALEAHGGLVTWGLRRVIPLEGGAAALTLGHVILGTDPASLDGCRDHEHVHVRQYQRWGPFFIPLYLAISLVLAVRGRDAYRENPFEREAYGSVPSA